jgi:hypothetical protein
LTGYKSEILGEFEIAAWEIASGCMNYTAAYLLNAPGLLAGLVLHTQPTLKAFWKGCHSSNFYQIQKSDEALKSATVEALREEAKLNMIDHAFRLRDIFHLLKHIFFSFMVQWVWVLLFPVILGFNIYYFLIPKNERN